MRRIYHKCASPDERNAILMEYLSGEESAREVAERHKMKVGTLNCWVSRYLKGEKVVSLPSEPQMEDVMPKKKEVDLAQENAELKQQVKELMASLRQSELKNLALTTMIDIAEEQGIQIRKKSGARQ